VLKLSQDVHLRENAEKAGSVKIGVKFAANCNPMIDTAALLAVLRADLLEHHFVFWDENSYEILLVLPPVGANCAIEDGFSGSMIKVDHESGQ